MARLNKQEAFELGFDHGYKMASESGSNDAGSDGWDGMLINADPAFVREKLGTAALLAHYCKGCQAGADKAVN